MTIQRVVVVEDDALLAAHYKRVLERNNYEVYTASDGPMAIDLIDDVLPDAVVLDVLLESVTAMALLHEMQSHHDLASIPVILATNLAQRVPLDDMKKYGVREVLDKATMRPADIVGAVRKFAS